MSKSDNGLVLDTMNRFFEAFFQKSTGNGHHFCGLLGVLHTVKKLQLAITQNDQSMEQKDVISGKWPPSFGNRRSLEKGKARPVLRENVCSSQC